MFLNAKYGKINMAQATMEYIRFGSGKKHLVMLPGLGDGLRTLKGTALPVAYMYRIFARDYTVWMLARKQPLETDCTTRTMAHDVKQAMDMRGIMQADIIGVSQGGMIAQWLALDSPAKVGRLVLAVTAPDSNETIKSLVTEWISMAENKDFKGLVTDNFEKSYTDLYLARYRWLYPVLVPFAKPQDTQRFILQAHSCLTHNALPYVEKITRPTLVIGGRQDKIVTFAASLQLAEKIPHSRLLVYDDYGHALYEEAKDFNRQLLAFLQEK